MTQVARDVYGQHLLDLTSDQMRRLPTFIALRLLEGESVDSMLD